MELTLDEAREAILSGTCPENLRLSGHLDFTESTRLTALPAGLQITRLTVTRCENLKALPVGLKCFDLDAGGSGLTTLPVDIDVTNRLNLSDCTALTTLPANLKVGTLLLENCPALERLPEGLDVRFLDISGCTALSGWPETAIIAVGRLSARNCFRLKSLPPYLTRISQLDLAGCEQISTLPEGLEVSSWLDLAGTGIASLPEALEGVRLRWKGVLVEERIVFRPETITAAEVLGESNTEIRRIKLERMGMERFVAEVKPLTLDSDTDPGGERRLLRITIPGDEDLVCLAVGCPSTGRRYMLRVPPTMQNCHQAAAWLAGYDDPELYAPLAET